MMNPSSYSNKVSGPSGFTLLEILLATAIFAIVLIAINTVFFAGLQLRKRTTEAIERSLPMERALATIKTDLQNAVPPGGTMSGFFRAGVGGNVSFGQGSMNGQAVSSASNLSLPGSGQGSTLDFFTTTAHLTDEEPWSEVQHVSYQLTEPAEGNKALGSDLVRVANRNLLTLTTPTPQTERLAGNIESLEFEFFDGTQWRQVWDTTGNDSSLPEAVLIRVLPAVDPALETIRREPLEMVVLVPAKGSSTTNTTTEASQ